MKKNYFEPDVQRKQAPYEHSPLGVFYELELHRVIEFQAYLRAERDGFRQSPLDYWLAAEEDVHQYF